MRWVEYGVFLTLVLVLARPVGVYLARVFAGERTFADPVLRPVERALYRVLGVDPRREMSAAIYFLCFLVFSLTGALLVFGILLFQQWLPGGPDKDYLTTPMTADLAANTAVSFATTATWQAYSGETTLRYLTQLIGLTAQNFLAGSAGLAVGMAFLRGFAREHAATLGNFWVDVVRGLLWVLLPLALVLGVLLVWQGVPMNMTPYVEGRTQVIPQGPVAALEAIKNLSSNGGGFFGVNGAHPYANPTPLTSFLAVLAIAVVPAGLPIAFGHMVGRPRAGWLLLILMGILFVVGLVVADLVESARPTRLANLSVTGANLEGKEVRFGVGDSVLTAVTTSNGATGSNNAMNDSLHPLTVLVLLVNMLLGEVAFGGLGTGLYSMIMVALLAVFLGGLMVGRTPEYLGKTIGQTEAKWVALFALLTPVAVLPLTGLALASDAGRAGLKDMQQSPAEGPHGLTEVLFAYASCTANNGQAMAGLDVNRPFYNLTTLVAMALGRFGLAGLALALAGRLAAQGRKTATIGTLPCDTVTFGVLVLGTILLVGALCFLPALVLGPVAEYYQP